jgi:hypothetical protein
MAVPPRAALRVAHRDPLGASRLLSFVRLSSERVRQAVPGLLLRQEAGVSRCAPGRRPTQLSIRGAAGYRSRRGKQAPLLSRARRDAYGSRLPDNGERVKQRPSSATAAATISARVIECGLCMVLSS